MSLSDVVAQQLNGARRLASARARLSVRSLLLRDVERSGLSNKELAEKLGLSKSAVGQVLNGNGNVRVNTLSDYLHEVGRELVVSSRPIQPHHAVEHRVWPKERTTQVELVWASERGVTAARGFVRHPSTKTLFSCSVGRISTAAELQDITERAVATEVDGALVES